MKKEIKVFTVDDSALARHAISEIVTKSEKNIKIVGGAPTGEVALQKLGLKKFKQKFKPDIVTMDIMMPGMDGFETIGHIMDRFPVPVIIVSSLSQKDIDASVSNIGMAAFESGLVEFVRKTSPDDSQDGKRFERELVEKILNLSQVNLTKAITGFDFQSYLEEGEIEKPIVPERPKRVLKKFRDLLIVIGASTGGPRAISLILSEIPTSFPPIVIIQHMPQEMVKQWVERLQKLYPHLNVRIPKNKELIQPNRVYIAPGGKHCAIHKTKRFRLYKGEKVNFLMPAIDVTFDSGAEVYGNNIIGVILTGMGKDGFEGSKKIKAVNGSIIAEHKSTCVIYGMPKVVIEGKLVDTGIPLHKISSVLSGFCWV
ncbi:MAG: chemotaxis-specific protein-glutamate methyltransferase CheB [Candidatus Hodarchaeales archaeon]|jgi:two-component system chemotaxis response regulator CheB